MVFIHIQLAFHRFGSDNFDRLPKCSANDVSICHVIFCEVVNAEGQCLHELKSIQCLEPHNSILGLEPENTMAKDFVIVLRQ